MALSCAAIRRDIIIIIIPCDFFTTALTNGPSLESERLTRSKNMSLFVFLDIHSPYGRPHSKV